MSHEAKPFGPYPLSGVPLRNGPETPFRAVGREQDRLKEIRSLTSVLGQECERIIMGLWSENVSPDPDNILLRNAVSGVRENLKVVIQRTFSTHARLAEVYQNLTEPAEVPFLGDERTWPSSPYLADLFSEVDRLYSTHFGQSFSELNTDPDGKVSSHIRYLVENALVIGRWTVDGPPKTEGRVVPNVKLFDKARKQLTQFDGVMLRRGVRRPLDEISQWLGGREPWWAIEVRVPNRARYISGPGKIRSVFQYDIAAYQQRLGRVLLEREGNFTLPRAILFAYLRGSQVDAIYSISVNSDFIRSWREHLEAKLEDGLISMDNVGSAKILVGYLMAAEKTALEKEKSREKRTRRRSKPYGKYFLQRGLF